MVYPIGQNSDSILYKRKVDMKTKTINQWYDCHRQDHISIRYACDLVL